MVVHSLTQLTFSRGCLPSRSILRFLSPPPLPFYLFSIESLSSLNSLPTPLHTLVPFLPGICSNHFSHPSPPFAPLLAVIDDWTSPHFSRLYDYDLSYLVTVHKVHGPPLHLSPLRRLTRGISKTRFPCEGLLVPFLFPGSGG